MFFPSDASAWNPTRHAEDASQQQSARTGAVRKDACIQTVNPRKMTCVRSADHFGSAPVNT